MNCLLLVTFLSLGSASSMHDNTRSLQALRMSEEDTAAYTAQSSAARRQHQHRVAEALKQHPEWQKVQAWKQRIKAGDPEAGAAYAGKLPHELLHHLVSDVADHVHQQEQDQPHMHHTARPAGTADAEL